MATINNIYVFVVSEELSRSSSVPQHPVEKGLPITDNVRSEPRTISISGKIVNTSKLSASEIIKKLEALRTGGSLIKYSGRNAAGNFMIKSFDTSHPNTNWGGADFDMELVEVRIAKSAYNAKKSNQKSAEKAKKVNNPTLKAGAKVVFKGGPVYASSDAKKAAANRGRSTCKIEIPNSKSNPIRTESWAIHPIHLVSTDGKKVYGWVDKANIEGTGSGTGAKNSTGTSSATNAGTQQVKKKETANLNKKGMKHTGTLAKQLIVGGDSFYESRLYKIEGTYYYKGSNNLYYPNSYIKNRKKRGVREWYFNSGTPIYKKEEAKKEIKLSARDAKILANSGQVVKEPKL